MVWFTDVRKAPKEYHVTCVTFVGPILSVTAQLFKANGPLLSVLYITDKMIKREFPVSCSILKIFPFSFGHCHGNNFNCRVPWIKICYIRGKCSGQRMHNMFNRKRRSEGSSEGLKSTSHLQFRNFPRYKWKKKKKTNKQKKN